MNSVADQTMVEGAIRHFPACGSFQNFVRITQGHINDTFRVKTDKGEYLLQRLSPTAFKKPLEVMLRFPQKPGAISRSREGLWAFPAFAF